MLSNLPVPTGADLTSQNFSSTQSILEIGKEWNEAGLFKSTAAHTLIPMFTVAASAFDALVHTLNALIKGSAALTSTAVYYGTLTKVSLNPGVTAGEVAKHTYRALGYTPMMVVQPLTAVISCGSALSVLQKANLIPKKTSFQIFKEGVGAFCKKVPTLPRSLFDKASKSSKGVKVAGAAVVTLLLSDIAQGYFRDVDTFTMRGLNGGWSGVTTAGNWSHDKVADGASWVQSLIAGTPVDCTPVDCTPVDCAPVDCAPVDCTTTGYRGYAIVGGGGGIVGFLGGVWMMNKLRSIGII